MKCLRTRYENESWLEYLWGHVTWVLGRRQITYWWQRQRRGFDDSDLWSLDYTFLQFILPRLKAFRQYNKAGFPTDMYTEEELKIVYQGEELPFEADVAASQRWSVIIDKMIRAIDLYLEDDMFLKKDEQGNLIYEGEEVNCFGDRGHPVEDPQLKQEFEEGWALFHKHFFSLWD